MPHIHERIDYCADMLIVNEGAVLLRMHEKYDKWLAPGGHVELDEDMVEAALRVAKEETGLTVKIIGSAETAEGDPGKELIIPRFINRHPINDVHEHISFIYFGTSEDRNVDPAPGESRDGFKWFTREDLDDPRYDVPVEIRLHAKAALDTAGA